MKYFFKSYYWEKLTFSKFLLSKFKIFVSRSQISLNFNASCSNLKIRGLGAKLCLAFWWTKIKTLIKTRQNRKRKFPHTISERWTLCLSSYKNRELKVKLWWGEAHERKKNAFFVTVILFEGNIFIFSQCILYWINFEKIYTFIYQK